MINSTWTGILIMGLCHGSGKIGEIHIDSIFSEISIKKINIFFLKMITKVSGRVKKMFFSAFKSGYNFHIDFRNFYLYLYFVIDSSISGLVFIWSFNTPCSKTRVNNWSTLTTTVFSYILKCCCDYIKLYKNSLLWNQCKSLKSSQHTLFVD